MHFYVSPFPQNDTYLSKLTSSKLYTDDGGCHADQHIRRCLVSVSCPRTLRHADHWKWTSNLPITRTLAIPLSHSHKHVSYLRIHWYILGRTTTANERGFLNQMTENGKQHFILSTKLLLTENSCLKNRLLTASSHSSWLLKPSAFVCFTATCYCSKLLHLTNLHFVCICFPMRSREVVHCYHCCHYFQVL